MNLVRKMNPDSPSRSAAGVGAELPDRKAAGTPRARLRDRLRAETRQAILAAAEEALGQHGARGARMELIAAAAGLAVGTLYNYFSDRQELIEALFELRRRELVLALDAALERSAAEPFEQQLAAFLRAGLEHFHVHRRFIALVMQDELTSGQGSRWSLQLELRARAERLVASGIDAGLLRPEDRATYPHVIVGLLKGLIEPALGASVDSAPLQRVQAAIRCFMFGARKLA
jgi:AcrR family transcriptional regulator